MVMEFEAALAVVLEHAAALDRPPARLTAELSRTAGSVLAEQITAQRDQPPFDRSTRDGFALRAADLAHGLKLVGSIRAGAAWDGPLHPGEAVEIMTGAPVPAGADAVLMVEHANVVDGTLHATEGRSLLPGINIVPRGSEARAGTPLLQPGQIMDAAAIAVAASCGRASIEVYAPVSVAIISTGDELIELDPTQPDTVVPAPEQIFNSNSYALAALVASEGGQALRLAIARDTLESLRARLAEAAEADLLLLTGGVSMGKFDLVEPALAALGAEFFFTGAKIQPGKPVVFGRVRRGERWQYFFGLPGNPVSAEVCFRLFVAPLLRALRGQRTDLAPRFVEATADEAFEGKPGLVRFLPARIEGDWRGVSVRPVTWQGSGDVAANARANAYCVVPETGVASGSPARVLLR